MIISIRKKTLSQLKSFRPKNMEYECSVNKILIDILMVILKEQH